jgi:hypothetical protein
MHYHIFEINPFEQLTWLSSTPDYRQAREQVRAHRKAPNVVAGTRYRMMFAADREQAERLLREKREPRPMGEHD